MVGPTVIIRPFRPIISIGRYEKQISQTKSHSGHLMSYISLCQIMTKMHQFTKNAHLDYLFQWNSNCVQNTFKKRDL